jgi:glycosyltransferase involved in cell wall biosynthesis
LARADAVVVKSEIEYLMVETIAKGSVHRIANAVGREFVAVTRVRGQDETSLLTVCQLEVHKGVATLLAALRGMRCRLTVVGDGSQRDRLRRAAAASGVRVDFLGRVPHSELPAIYASHGAFVLASTLEGCSNAVLEALAAGLPVIGNRSALSDLVEDGVDGVLADAPDERSLVAALRRFLDPGTDREAMSAAARNRAEPHSPERLAAEYAVLLASLRETRRLRKGLAL